MNLNATKIASVAVLATAFTVIGGMSGVFAYFSTSPAPSGCTDAGYGFQTGSGYGYEITCPTSSSGGGGGGGGSGSASSRDYCPSGDLSGNFRDGRCEAFVDGSDTTTDSDTDTSTETTTTTTTSTGTTSTGGTNSDPVVNDADVPSSLLELIRNRNDAATTGGSSNTDGASGMGTIELPTFLPQTGGIK